MALFIGGRDISLFHSVNKEMINKWIDSQVDIYQTVLDESNTDIYGEATNTKRYYQPIRINALITRNDQEFNNDEMGIDLDQTATFAFLTKTLEEKNFLPEIGDIIEWNNAYWEIDSFLSNQLIGSKNPDTAKSLVREFGKDFSIVFNAHMSRIAKLNIEEVR